MWKAIGDPIHLQGLHVIMQDPVLRTVTGAPWTSLMSTPGIPPNVLATPQYVDIFHPFHQGIPILSLPKNNIVTQTPSTYGVYHHIALAACKIIAYNTAGFLSTSIRRNDRNARASLQTDQFLTSTSYYYHWDLALMVLQARKADASILQ